MELTTATTTTLDEETEAALRECLLRSSALGGGGADVVRVARRQLGTSTSYDTWAVTFELSDGGNVRAFLKDFGHSLRPKDEPRHRRDREMRFYRDIAPDGALGVPRYFGSIWDDVHQRHWLLLEFVQGTPVRYIPFHHWVRAVGWLGRMHGHFARQIARLDGLSFLEHQTRAFFSAKASQAVLSAEAHWPDLGERLRRALDDYDRAIDAMLDGPRTLLHGGFHALNVLAELPGEPDRLCVIDWEESGVGAALSDLSYFCNGFDGERLDQMLGAYYAGAGKCDLSLPERRPAVHMMKCFRLHKLIQSLPKYASWEKRKESTMPKLVAHAERYAAEVRRGLS